MKTKLYLLIIFLSTTVFLKAMQKEVPDELDKMKQKEMPVSFHVVDNKIRWEREVVRSEEGGSEYHNLYCNDFLTGHWKLTRQVAHCQTDGFRYERITQYTVRPNDVLVEIARFMIREKDNVRTSIDDGEDQVRIITHRKYDELDQKRGGVFVEERLFLRVPMDGGTINGTGMD